METQKYIEEYTPNDFLESLTEDHFNRIKDIKIRELRTELNQVWATFKTVLIGEDSIEILELYIDKIKELKTKIEDWKNKDFQSFIEERQKELNKKPKKSLFKNTTSDEIFLYVFTGIAFLAVITLPIILAFCC